MYQFSKLCFNKDIKDITYALGCSICTDNFISIEFKPFKSHTQVSVEYENTSRSFSTLTDGLMKPLLSNTILLSGWNLLTNTNITLTIQDLHSKTFALKIMQNDYTVFVELSIDNEIYTHKLDKVS